MSYVRQQLINIVQFFKIPTDVADAIEKLYENHGLKTPRVETIISNIRKLNKANLVQVYHVVSELMNEGDCAGTLNPEKNQKQEIVKEPSVHKTKNVGQDTSEEGSAQKIINLTFDTPKTEEAIEIDLVVPSFVVLPNGMDTVMKNIPGPTVTSSTDATQETIEKSTEASTEATTEPTTEETTESTTEPTTEATGKETPEQTIETSPEIKTPEVDNASGKKTERLDTTEEINNPSKRQKTDEQL